MLYLSIKNVSYFALPMQFRASWEGPSCDLIMVLASIRFLGPSAYVLKPNYIDFYK